MKNIIADRTNRIDASGIRKVFALGAALKDPVNFSIGQPDFDTPQELKDQAIQAIQDGFNKYSQTAGDDELLDKITQKVKGEFGWQQPSVIVTSGVSGGLSLMFLATVNPGDEVIMSDPYFVSYKHIVNMLGGKCVYIDSYPDFALSTQKIADAVTEKTKLLLVNSPSNPTGVVYSAKDLQELAEIAAEKGIPVVSDEIYDAFCYEDSFTSIAKFYDKTLLLRGFGKSCGMTGWRLGYAAAGRELAPVIEQMMKLQQYTFVCAPAPLQRAAIAAVDYDISKYVNLYRAKRDMLYEGLKDKYEFIKPAGAFYAFLKVPGNLTATEFAAKAIQNNLLVIPGSVFSQKDTHFRISYATSDEKIHRGIEILRRLA